MSRGITFWESELFHRLQSILPNHPPVYLVGGAVRDALLNRPVHDVDFVLSGDVRPLARKTADALGGSFYMLDDERNTARVIDRRNGQELILDFATFRAETIEQDLKSRDFTINAMAVDMADVHQLIDPLNGLSDLHKKVLRACSPEAFQDDPIRILRAVRLALWLNFKIDPQTYQWMTAATDLLPQTSGERQRDEIMRMLGERSAASALRLLDHAGALETVLPETGLMKGMHQSPPHTQDVWEHTLAVLRELERLYHLLVEPFDQEATGNLLHGTASLRLGRFRDNLREHFHTSLNPNRSMRSLLFLAALYHDVGKPETAQVEESGRVRFFEHEEVGMKIISRRAREFALSQVEVGRVETIVRHHMRIHHLANTGDPPSRRAIFRFFKAAGPAGVDICLLSLADLAGTYQNTLPQEKWLAELEISAQLLEAWYEKPAEMVKPERLLTGNDILKALGLTPGPAVGELLDALQEAQACGEVNTRQEALDFINRLYVQYRQRKGRMNDNDNESNRTLL